MFFRDYLFIKKKVINKYIENHSLLKKKNFYNIDNYNIEIFFNNYGWTLKKLNYNLNKIKDLRKRS